jgi:predicted TPR repeat methyltransferase
MAPKTLVEKWYDARAEIEEHRLDAGRLEFEVTMHIIHSCLSTLDLRRPANILDIGGGPGRYGMYCTHTQTHTATYLPRPIENTSNVISQLTQDIYT